ncbi:MAG TPA: hypothetical protein VJU77_03705 [Chthoniobacterales bacterium]|nr:hypothetical protein [Chthoniobacterales bacterium]
MKNATLLFLLFVSALLTNCAGVSPTRIVGDTVAASGGAFIGNKRSNGNPLITTAAAGGGVLLQRNAPGAEQRLGAQGLRCRI